MTLNYDKGCEIKGHLDIFATHNADEFEGKILKWGEVLIHGDPEGLRSLAKLLNSVADLNQEALNNKILPTGARQHYHLTPGLELASSSFDVIIGRLDAKGTGAFYDRYVPKENKH